MLYIYMLTNTINGKKYIGFTSQPIEQRIRQHQYKSSQCPLISNAIQKYGISSFVLRVLEESSDEKRRDEFLNKLEPHYIEKYQPEYNLTRGGDGTPGTKGPRYKTRVPVIQYDRDGKYMREWDSAKSAGDSLGIKNDQITRVCKRTYGVNFAGNFQWRYKHDAEPEINRPQRYNNRRLVVEVKTGKVFGSVKEAANYKNCTKGAICYHLTKGIHWKYVM